MNVVRSIALLVASCCSFAACAHDETAPDSGEGPTTESIELDVPRRPVAPESSSGEYTRAELEDLYAQASREIADQRYETALERISGVLESDPPASWAGKFQVLRFQLKERILEETYLDAFVRFNSQRFTIGDIIEGELVLMNISTKPLLIPAVSEVDAPRGGGAVSTPTVMKRTMIYREFIPTNTVVTQTDATNLLIDTDIRLQPGEAFRIPVAIDTSLNNIAGTMLRSYEFGADLRGARIIVGDEIFNENIHFAGATVYVYPRGAEHLADDPMRRVRESWRKNAPVHLHLAASLVGATQRSELIDFIEENLADPSVDEDMMRALMTCARIVSGLDQQGDRVEWLAWARAQ